MMRASGELPFTPVDHHQFSDNMNVVARVMNGGVELTNLCVAAFVDSECRGVTTATTDGYYMLTVAGNAEEAGKTVRFATMYNNEITWFDEQLQWRSDWIYGDLDEPLIFHLPSSGIIDVNGDVNTIVITPTIVTDVINVYSGDWIESVNVFSASGALVARVTPGDDKAVLNLSHLASGVYFVEARTYSGVRAVKQIIKR